MPVDLCIFTEQNNIYIYIYLTNVLKHLPGKQIFTSFFFLIFPKLLAENHEMCRNGVRVRMSAVLI